MGFNGHDRTVTLAASSDEDNVPHGFQISPHSGGPAPELRHADVLFFDQEIQLPGLVYSFIHAQVHSFAARG